VVVALVLAGLSGCRGGDVADGSEYAALFDRTVYCFEGSYETARRRLLRRGERVRPLLLQERDSPDPERELTARILLGWLDHEPEFRTVSQYVRGRRRVPSGLPLFGRSWQEDAIITRRGMYAANSSQHAYLWLIEQWWKGLELDEDADVAAGIALSHALNPQSDVRMRHPPNLALAQRLWAFAQLDGKVRDGTEIASMDVDTMWRMLRRATRGGASVESRVRLANFNVLTDPSVDSLRRPVLLRFYADVSAAPLPDRFHEVADAATNWLLPDMERYPYPQNTEYRLRQRTEARRALLMRPLRTCPGD
jgi:hypothetical protein